MQHPTLIFVNYDGIHNPVFQGQILAPLLDRKKNNPTQSIVIINFERTIPTQLPIQHEALGGIQLIFLRRLPFFGSFTLLYAAIALWLQLRKFSSYDLIARGPLAAYAVRYAMNKKKCRSLIIQARGLLAEEYAFIHKKTNNFFINCWNRWRFNQIKKIEHATYNAQKLSPRATIEAVSPALKEYLIKTYHADPQKITIAQHDCPPLIEPQTKAVWRQEIRAELQIPESAHVYCYNGSIQAWQCPDETISFFKKKLTRTNNCFLLVLTQNPAEFITKIEHAGIPHTHYCVKKILHKEVYRYLSACDSGIIFRTPSPVNWVARPTKAIEYIAASLHIVHNNTVSWLSDYTKEKLQKKSP